MNALLKSKILNTVAENDYKPLKPRALARQLGLVGDSEYVDFRDSLRELIREGKVEIGTGRSIRLAKVTARRDQVIGVFRPIRRGGGFVRPRAGQPGAPVEDIRIRDRYAADAAAGDLVLVTLARGMGGPRGRYGRPSANLGPQGRIEAILERASQTFVGTYKPRGGEGFVRVDGGQFQEPIYVGDAGAKGATDGDKVVFEMLRFPSQSHFGEGVIVEVLGPKGNPGIDILSVVRALHIPDSFSPEVLADAREQVRLFEEQSVTADRLDLTDALTITIDPVDARDFDDAISLEKTESGWKLGVHVADVSSFVRVGLPMDQEAAQRGTSVYLPGLVIPMLPELISNGLASLQENHVRLTKSAFMEWSEEGERLGTSFANSAIRNRRRLNYPEVQKFFDSVDAGHPAPPAHWPEEVTELVLRMRELAALLRKRRRSRGFLELDLPEAELEFDNDGKVVGAHWAPGDESHRVIEEFMLSANEAVAERLHSVGAVFARRTHEPPEERKLRTFADFARSLGYTVRDHQSRFELQKLLVQAAKTPHRHAIHYALLRSLKEAVYSSADEGHWAIASGCYCHFTSPIRRYPDLMVHRLLDQWLRREKVSSDPTEVARQCEHASMTERRAAKAEREVVRLRLLEYCRAHLGEEVEMIVTGVEEFGLFLQGTDVPVEGLLHVRSLPEDFYRLDRVAHTLEGRRAGNQFRLGDRLRCILWRVDDDRHELDLQLARVLNGSPPSSDRPNRFDRSKGSNKGRFKGRF